MIQLTIVAQGFERLGGEPRSVSVGFQKRRTDNVASMTALPSSRATARHNGVGKIHLGSRRAID
jgi:hypothetical protein